MWRLIHVHPSKHVPSVSVHTQIDTIVHNVSIHTHIHAYMHTYKNVIDRYIVISI